jgi:hypothetical protein
MKIQKKLFTIFVVGIISILLSACATMPLSAQNAKLIHTVGVSKHVQVPKGMFFAGPGSYCGLIGLALASATEASTQAAIQKSAIDNHINIDQIVRNELLQQIQQSGKFQLGQTSKSDGAIYIKILQYGFTVPTTYSWEMVPYLIIQAKMLNKQGIMIWRDRTFVEPLFNGLPEYSMSELKQNPATISHSWNVAAQKAVAKMMKSL